MTFCLFPSVSISKTEILISPFRLVIKSKYVKHPAQGPTYSKSLFFPLIFIFENSHPTVILPGEITITLKKNQIIISMSK